jgi:hypothetical protein
MHNVVKRIDSSPDELALVNLSKKVVSTEALGYTAVLYPDDIDAASLHPSIQIAPRMAAEWMQRRMASFLTKMEVDAAQALLLRARELGEMSVERPLIAAYEALFGQRPTIMAEDVHDKQEHEALDQKLRVLGINPDLLDDKSVGNKQRIIINPALGSKTMTLADIKPAAVLAKPAAPFKPAPPQAEPAAPRPVSEAAERMNRIEGEMRRIQGLREQCDTFGIGWHPAMSEIALTARVQAFEAGGDPERYDAKHRKVKPVGVAG